MDLKSALFCLWVCLIGGGTPIALPSQSADISPAFGDRIIELDLSFDENAKRSLMKKPDTPVSANLAFKDISGAVHRYNVKIHIKGQAGSKRPLDKKPAFRVKLEGTDRFYGLAELTLNNMVQDPTMLHEAVGYSVYEAAGAYVPATGYARLRINGQDNGIYLNLESIDSRFLMRRFGDDTGILYEGSYGTDLRSGDIGKSVSLNFTKAMTSIAVS
jgi:spore coat protein CotH